jgi:hypothetical protein
MKSYIFYFLTRTLGAFLLGQIIGAAVGAIIFITHPFPFSAPLSTEMVEAGILILSYVTGAALSFYFFGKKEGDKSKKRKGTYALEVFLAVLLILLCYPGFRMLVYKKATNAPQFYQAPKGSIISIVYPTGYDSFSLGTTITIEWTSAPVPSGSWVKIDFFKIMGEKPLFDAHGECLNCSDKDVPSSITTTQPISSERMNKVDWSVGKLDNGTYVTPGGKYALRATLKKKVLTHECESLDACSAILDIAWGYGDFTILKMPSTKNLIY